MYSRLFIDILPQVVLERKLWMADGIHVIILERKKMTLYQRSPDDHFNITNYDSKNPIPCKQ